MTELQTDRPPTSPETLLARLVALGIDAATHHHPPVFTVEESRALRGERRVEVVLDRAMMAHEWLNYHPLENDRTTTIRSTDLLRFIAACGHAPRLLDVVGS